MDGLPDPFAIKSDLFSRTIILLSSSRTSLMSASCRFLSAKVISSLCSRSVTSRTNRTLCALASSSFVISIPSYSMRSSVSERRPAVSVRVTICPNRFRLVDTQSLVVPGISLTMETRLFASKFISVLLPALGGPTIATFSPSRIVSAT